MKLVKIISEYNEKKHPGKGGMVEAIGFTARLEADDSYEYDPLREIP